jgi:hypothetical protein
VAQVDDLGDGADRIGGLRPVGVARQRLEGLGAQREESLLGSLDSLARFDDVLFVDRRSAGLATR